jgi:hypothetical protein
MHTVDGGGVQRQPQHVSYMHVYTIHIHTYMLLMGAVISDDHSTPHVYIHTYMHACIQLMGVVISDDHSTPLLVMEFMEFGSLYDLLHNESVALEGDLLLPVLRDVAQGMR